jgi:hypothetical protein
MATDLNLNISEIKKTGTDVERKLKDFLGKYDSFYREALHQYESERTASGIKGLEDFYRLVQTVKRNRDVIGSLLRGMDNLRPITEFRWVEEDIPETIPIKPKKKATSESAPPPEGIPDGLSVPELISAVEAAKEEEKKEVIDA